MNNDLTSYFEDPEFKEILAKYEGMVNDHTSIYFDAEELTDIAEYYASQEKEAEAEKARNLLKDYTPLTNGESENFSKGTMVLPIRYVKGLEFDTVILWNPDMKQGLEQPETAKLLYVACTRALHELHILNS